MAREGICKKGYFLKASDGLRWVEEETMTARHINALWQLKGFKSHGRYHIWPKSDVGRGKGRKESSCPLKKTGKIYQSISQIVFLQIIKCICPESDVGSGKGRKESSCLLEKRARSLLKSPHLFPQKNPTFWAKFLTFSAAQIAAPIPDYLGRNNAGLWNIWCAELNHLNVQ